MSEVVKRFYGPTNLPTTATTLYTVPAGYTAVIEYVSVANDGVSDYLMTMSIGADAADTRVFDALRIAGHGVYILNTVWVLAAGEILQGFASASFALQLTLIGRETRSP